MKIGIFGVGEVGKALLDLYKENDFDVIEKDKFTNFKFKNIDILNICIPYNEIFCDIVLREINDAKPKLTIIHSTIPIGTTRKIQENTKYKVIHSPVIGSHPFLKKNLKTFVKHFSYSNKKCLKLANSHFKKLKIKTKSINLFEATEAAKLMCTGYYGVCIAWHDYMKRVCDQNKIDFSFIKEWNKNYNLGYAKNKLSKFNRPILDPPINSKIGGHCIIPNAEILNDQFPNNLLLEVLKFKK